MKADDIKQQGTSHSNPPLISIGLPTYNGDKRIVSTVTAILNQNYPNLEIIISDNCSTDDTESVCTKLCQSSPLIHYFRQKENIGIILNFKFVLSKAAGDFFMWVADDDTLAPGVLQKYADFLISHSSYSLVSGEIRYWWDNRPVFDEKGFSIEHALSDVRVSKYYSRVKHGATFYGLMPIAVAKQIRLKNRMGEDWHVVAKVAYLGKIKMLDGIGYHKKLNGSSKTLRHYAKIIGASWFSTNYPHAQIAIDAFLEIMTSSFYNDMRWFTRLKMALNSFAGILFNYYWREYPYIVGGRIKRMLGFKRRWRVLPSPIKKKWHPDWR
jgi:glycosyltransferase involved in cell wall biosynthesis